MQYSEQKLPLALTIGDPSGIGPEIALKAWQARNKENLTPFCLISPKNIPETYAELLKLDVKISVIRDISEALGFFDNSLPVLELSDEKMVEAGKPNPELSEIITGSIEKAVELSINGQASGVVTNPISKEVLYKSGFKHPGHTEYLAELGTRHTGNDIKSVMMLASDELRVVPVTIHIALKDVPKTLTQDEIIRVIKTTAQDLTTYFNIEKPRIAVAGLNPHAGENGNMGLEEIEVIIPAVETLQKEGYHVTGPHPADTMFHARARQTYDVVVAMYHDQALIPLKTLDFDKGVNVTLGLPFIRTSPDHGTAFDIAGKGVANPQSLIEAIKLASHMAANSKQQNL